MDFKSANITVPGPLVPLYVLGNRMCSATAYVPIAGGTRCSIGIFSYLNTMTFGVNADFDGYPDVDVLSGGIRRGIEELMAVASARSGGGKPSPAAPPPESAGSPADSSATSSGGRTAKAPAKRTRPARTTTAAANR